MFSGPSYSNAAYSVLGLVIEAASGKPYDVAVQDLILKPLSLTRTSVRPPRDSAGNVVAPDPAWWTYDEGVQNPYALSFFLSIFPLSLHLVFHVPPHCLQTRFACWRPQRYLHLAYYFLSVKLRRHITLRSASRGPVMDSG